MIKLEINVPDHFKNNDFTITLFSIWKVGSNEWEDIKEIIDAALGHLSWAGIKTEIAEVNQAS